MKKIILVFIIIFCIAGCTEKQNNTKQNTTKNEIAVIGKKEQIANKTPKKKVLRSHLAGKWYPGNKKELTRQIKKFMAEAKGKKLNNIIGLIMPHAGYRYSGKVAAHAMKILGKKYKRIIILGLSHQLPMEDVISIPQITHYRTPLGDIHLDLEFIKKLRKYPMVISNPHAHKREHSIQIEIPFIQYCQPDVPIVPIIAGKCSLKMINKIASILSGLIDEQTLVISSTDFIHYGPRFNFTPFPANPIKQMHEMNAKALEYIIKKDHNGFIKYVNKTGATICGRMPVAILLAMLPKNARGIILDKYDSSRVTYDTQNIVCYIAAAFTGKWEKKAQVKHSEIKGWSISKKEKKILIKIARNTLKHAFKTGKIANIKELDIKINENLKKIRAVFITLKKNGYLRGCIGSIYPTRPLYKSVIFNTIGAAFRDPRFPALDETEMPKITISISVLTVPEQVSSYKKIKIGRDGIILEKKGRRSVYLPQVATEQGWDLKTTLSHLSRKAGLAIYEWKKGAKLSTFQAIVFSEKNF